LPCSALAARIAPYPDLQLVKHFASGETVEIGPVAALSAFPSHRFML